MPETPETTPVTRCAIVGTAPTWKAVPWDDPTLAIWALNDMHLMSLPRVDRWYDLHPFDQFYYRDPKQGVLRAEDVQAGMFVRPVGHLDWLAKQSIPVYVQKTDARVPRGIVFPRAEIEVKFGAWFDSTPAWMVAHALLEGYREIHIYGIHLATEWEYLKQKPNMVYLLGLAVGLGAKIVLAKGSPLLGGSHAYAYEADPALPVTEAHRAMARLERELAVLTKQVGSSRWMRRADPVLQARVRHLKARILDAQLQVEWALAHKRATAR